jgi:excisionase family DNA binding protein
MEDKFLTTAEAAKIMGISRIAVFQKIKAGEIKAERFGRAFAIPTSEIIKKERGLSEDEKDLIRNAVRRTVKEYGETLKMLGRE